MLYPQSNQHRSTTSLDGLWDFRIQRPEDDASQWHQGFSGGRPIAVPASFNEQFTDYDSFNHMGIVWYARQISFPEVAAGRRIYLHFGAVNYQAEVFLDGRKIGAHVTGYTPFECDLGGAVGGLLVVRVDCALTPETVPQGGFDKAAIPGLTSPFHPSVNFDFFPFSGILRSVLLCSSSAVALDSLRIDAMPLEGTAQVRIATSIRGKAETLRISVMETGEGGECPAGEVLEFSMTDPKLWDLWQPNLYTLLIEVIAGGKVVDSYSQTFGVRCVKIEGDRLLLNGKAVYLQGFGRHEDFPVIGRGHSDAVNVRDMELLRWIGANSFRTAHYPHAEEMLDLADRLGVLVIAESPAVSMIPTAATETTLNLHCQVVQEMIRRDANHPCVIAWCLANEAHSHLPEAVPYFEKVFAVARKEDTTRPMTIVMCRYPDEKCHHLCDFIGLNAYPGWYGGGAALHETQAYFSQFLDEVHSLSGKPILMTEFGADAMAGLHSLPASLWTEDYQSDLIQALIDVLREKDYILGEHLWAFADFHTAQNHFRAYGNRKGLFTRDRQPKLAARVLRDRWRKTHP